MNITINDRKFWINWNYTNLPTTQCQIWGTNEDGEKFLAFSGTSYQSATDQHCKETARKISLARAIKPLTKTSRTEIWKQYFERIPKTK